MSYLLNALLIVIPVSVAIIGVFTLLFQRQLGRHRGVSREDFIRAFEGSEVSLQVVVGVYDYYSSRAISTSFSVSPDDNYESVLWEGEEDIEDDTKALIRILGINALANSESVRPDTHIRDIRDMVHWLDKLSKLRTH